MFLRGTNRKKDGKVHRYFSVVENTRAHDGRVVQRPLLYLGEINSSQELAWRKSTEVFDEDDGSSRELALFPEDRCEGALPGESVVRLRLSQLQLRRTRQWGGCYLALPLWRELELDEFWGRACFLHARYYLKLVEVEQAFRALKGDLAIRPIHH